MPSLVIPPNGLSLEASGKPTFDQGDIIGLTLSDDVIEGMIQSVRKGEPINLSLGHDPRISFGTNSQSFATSRTDPFRYQIFQSYNTTTKQSNTMPYVKLGPASENPFFRQFIRAKLKPVGKVQKAAAPTAKTSVVASRTSSASPADSSEDQALAQLSASIAEAKERKSRNTTTHIKNTSSLPPANQKRGAVQPIKAGGKARFLAGGQKGSNGSMPSSPALSGVGSPALASTSVPLSQQQAERAKAIRTPLIHQLAIGPASESSLLELKPSDVTAQEFKLAIAKVSDMVGERYELRQKAWKDLDVFKHPYKSEEDRQAVINSAIRVYDKLRLNSSEPEWDRLLPFSERGKGKCLSKLQSKIAVGAAMPPAKPKVKRSQNDSGRDSEGVDELFGNDTPKAKTDKMVKSKKDETLKDKRAPAKASAGAKAAPAKAAAKKAVAKSKPKETGTFKSSQYVSDSDEEEETEPLRSKPALPSTSLKQQSSAKSITKTTSTKRAADEMVDTRAAKKLKEVALSSSSTKTSTQQRTSDSSSSSTKDSSSRPMKPATGAKRTTSPAKSSPLASSPPTNASEIGHTTGQSSSSVSPGSDSSHNDIKRKLDSDSSTEETRNRRKISKKAVTAAEMQSNYDDSQFNHVPSQDAIELALRYESLYDDYIKLYDEIQKDEQKKMQEYGRFMVMHGQMTEMKRTLIQMSRDPTEDMSDGAGASN